MLNLSVRSAPPLSTWDAPEPRDSNFNRFARREVTKATRAAEYWASEADDYALPGQRGFTSAGRLEREHRDRMNQPNNVTRSPKPQAVLLPSKNHQFPEMPKFSFNNPVESAKQAGLGSFTNASTSSLAMMKNLGLPSPDPSNIGTASPRSAGGSSPMLGPTGANGFQASAAAGLAGMKGLGIPDLPGAGGEVKLVQGKKRLGMGRPQPWGVKKARAEGT